MTLCLVRKDLKLPCLRHLRQRFRDNRQFWTARSLYRVVSTKCEQDMQQLTQVQPHDISYSLRTDVSMEDYRISLLQGMRWYYVHCRLTNPSPRRELKHTEYSHHSHSEAHFIYSYDLQLLPRRTWVTTIPHLPRHSISTIDTPCKISGRGDGTHWT